jgi:hypothetical protein
MLTVVLVMVVPRPGNPHVNVAFAFVDEMFPVTWSVDKITLPPIELGWGGYTAPLIEETVSWGVETQLLPVIKVPVTWLEPTTVLKLADRPNTC